MLMKVLLHSLPCLDRADFLADQAEGSESEKGSVVAGFIISPLSRSGSDIPHFHTEIE